MAMRQPSFSIVVESANMGPSGLGELRACLSSLGRQPELARARDVVVLAAAPVHGIAAELSADFAFVRVEESPLGTYAAMKAEAASLVHGDVVLLCDSDCTYQPGWVSSMLAPFSEPTVDVVAGETAIRVRGPYSLAVALAFNFPPYSGDRGPAPARRYWANNVAMRRELLRRVAPPIDGDLGRGHCVLHAQQLLDDGATIVRQPRARAVHATPPLTAFAGRFYALGRDRVLLDRRQKGRPARRPGAFPPDRDGQAPAQRISARLRLIVDREPRLVFAVPFAIPIVAAAAACHEAGRAVTTRKLARVESP